jgi:hypothetical protein
MGQKALLGMALSLLVLPLAYWSLLPIEAQNPFDTSPPSTNTSFDSTTKYSVPSSNGTVSFASGGSYANAALDGNVWDFTGFYTTRESSALPNIFGVRFSVSANDCKVTVTHMDVLNVVPPFPGRLDYSVSGVGTQAFNMHYSNLRLLNWTVYFDGASKAEGDGWAVSPDGWVNVTAANADVSIRWKEVATVAFSKQANFALPLWNSSINFASVGSFLGEPNLVNNTWIFQNLALNGSVPRGIPLWVFEVSAQNNNVTIESYNPGVFVGAVNGSAWLNYTVVGVGSQNVSLGYGDSNGGLGPYVYIDGENKTQGNGWFPFNDGWLGITGAASNVSIYYPPNPELYGLPPPGIRVSLQSFNFFFFGIAVAMIIIVAVALTIIKLRRSKRLTAQTKIFRNSQTIEECAKIRTARAKASNKIPLSYTYNHSRGVSSKCQ